MRAFDLASLGARAEPPLRFRPMLEGRLLLPSFVPESSKEPALHLLQRTMAARPLTRIEVDWYRRIFPTDERFLHSCVDKHGADSWLLVVRVRGDGVSLQDVLQDAAIHRFEHVVIAADLPMRDERLGLLSELCAFVTRALEDAYDEIARDLSLRFDATESIADLVPRLADPARIVDAFNALVDVQVEGIAVDEQKNAIQRRVLRRLFESLTLPEQLVVHFAVSATEPTSDQLDPTTIDAAWRSLADQLLANGRSLAGWTALLRDPSVSAVTREVLEAQHAEAHEHEERLSRVFSAQQLADRARLLDRVLSLAEQAVREGRTQLTEELVSEASLLLAGASLAQRQRLSLVRGNLLHREALARLPDARAAEELFREALQVKRAGKDNPDRISFALQSLAHSLETQGRYGEAEPLYREALQLEREINVVPLFTSVAARALARSIFAQGRSAEAEPLFREALQLSRNAGLPPSLVATFSLGLAQSILAQSRPAEAEPLFRDALDLFSHGESKPDERAEALRGLAACVLALGRADEAASLEAQASALDPTPITPAP